MESDPHVKLADGHSTMEAGQARKPETSDASLPSIIFPAYPCPRCTFNLSEINQFLLVSKLNLPQLNN